MAGKCSTSLLQTFSGPFPPPYPGSLAQALGPYKYLIRLMSRIDPARQVADDIPHLLTDISK